MKMDLRIAACAAAALMFVAAPAAMAAPAPKASAAAFANLPDWTGVWQGTGTLFAPTGAITDGNRNDARNHPPYNADWEARYTNFLKEVLGHSKYVDPATLCYAAGFPRLAGSPFGIQFVPTPEMTYVFYERPGSRFIFTDGRPHQKNFVPTPEGDSIGHWEGDTLVVDTVGMRSGVPVDRTGMVFSPRLQIVERIRRTSMNQIEDVLTFTDPIALTGPWVVKRVYNRQQEKFAAIGNIACAESQRNPIVGGENTVVLGSERAGATGIYPSDVAPFAVPYGLDKP
jgi:hypothetical protein